VFNIAPKRANWDLKRETDKKLAKLERKTQEAIHTLIRACTGLFIRHISSLYAGQRLASQQLQSDDLVGAMNAEQKAQEDAGSDED